jgi:hypothetical protein
MSNDTVPELTTDLDHWEVKLKDGNIVSLGAHGFAERDDAYVFVALMKGSPPFEYEVARVPAGAVDEVEGGWPTPRT